MVYYLSKSFSPTIEAINVPIKKSLQKLTGSLNMKMPISTVPTAPTPAKTAYAVPIGIVFEAIIKKSMLKVSEAANPPYHNHMVRPDVCSAFTKQEVKPTSKQPASIKINQFIACKYTTLKNLRLKIC